MCGICGFNHEDKSLIKKMCNLIKHRGPNDAGYYIDSMVSLGMQRLSIIDLNIENQPQYDENNTIWVISDGEIYNFRELRKILEEKGHYFYTNSDTEVILHSYEEWNLDCFNKFRGVFATCIYDIERQRLILARDPLGIKPLYYYFKDSKFIFGSEIKCILLHEIKKILNKHALNLYISLNYVINNLTLFNNIYKVPPSSYLIYDLKENELETLKYFHFNFNIDNFNDEITLAKELRSLLNESVKLRLISDVPIGAFLSGGIDSSIVVGLMSQFMDNPVKTFSVKFEKGAPVNESKYAKLVSEYFQTDHTELIVKSNCHDILPELVWYFDDLISDPAIIPVYFMSKLAKKKVKVALTGDGADEIFAGYAEYYRLNKKNYLKHVPKKPFRYLLPRIYHFIPSPKIQLGVVALHSMISEENEFFKHLMLIKDMEKKTIFPYQVENVQSLLKNNLLEGLNKTNRYIYHDVSHQLPNFYNMKTDKMSMAASLETRVPFLDKEIVQWSLRIPSYFKLKNKTEKYILRLAVKDLLPPLILKRKKLGFGTPINFWLKTGMNEISCEFLERLEKRNSLIRPEYVQKVRKNRTSNFYGYRAWNLMMFEIWYETFFENDLKILNT